MKVEILGVKIDDVSMAEAVAGVEKWVGNPGKHYIVTPNPEFLAAAQKDSVFKQILNNADLAIPDGAGLRLSGKIKHTFSGADFMEELVKLAVEKGFTTGFLGGREGVAKRTAECLKKKYPGLKVVFAESGGEVNKEGIILRVRSEATNREVTLKNIDSSKGMFSTNRSNNNIPSADILFIAFGHIKQEKWIADNLGKIPIKVAMGVGGAFDYLSGSIPRAPRWIRNVGLEWLFRLVVQPWRIKRQLALFKYLWLLAVK